MAELGMPLTPVDVRLPASDRRVLALAWSVTLAVSLLPEILWRSATGSQPAWMLTAKLALLGGVVAAGFIWKVARPLRRYFLLLAVLLLIQWLSGAVEGSERWRRLF